MEAARGLYVLEPRNSPSQSGYIYRKLEPVRTNYSSGLFAVPPYPEPLGVEPFHSALRAVRDESGWRAVVGTLTWDGERRQYFITVESEGFRNPRYEFLARYDVRENVEANEPSALPGEWIGDRFYVANQIPGWVYTLIRVVDTDAKIDEIYYGPDNFTTFK